MTDDIEDDGFVTVHVSPYHAAQGTRAEVAAMLGGQPQTTNARAAADRIEALVKERDDAVIKRAAWELEAKTRQHRNEALVRDNASLRAEVRRWAEKLEGTDALLAEATARAERLEAVLREIGDNPFLRQETRRFARAALEPVTPAPDAAAIREAWERSYWRLRSYAVHDNDCKLNKPPRFDGPCSCGMTAALEEALDLITEKPHDRA